MAITRVNGVIKYPPKKVVSEKRSRRKSRRALSRQERKKEKMFQQQKLESKYLQNHLRKIWDFDSRQNKRWLVAKQQGGCVSASAAEIIHQWLKAKTPEKEARILKPWQVMSPSDELKEAWRVWATLKEERAIAMANVKGGICADWWRKEELRAEDE